MKDGKLSVRGMRKTGLVVSTKSKKTAVIRMDFMRRIPKYKRWARDSARMVVHNPEEINAKVGDMVRVGETRKISKTKSWVILEIIKGDEPK